MEQIRRIDEEFHDPPIEGLLDRSRSRDSGLTSIGSPSAVVGLKSGRYGSVNHTIVPSAPSGRGPMPHDPPKASTRFDKLYKPKPAPPEWRSVADRLRGWKAAS